jgi:hypothetical protein
MVHRTQITKRIWTNEVVYRTSPLGNLDRNIWIRDMAIPLQEGFDGDCQRCLPIAIDNLTAFALEQRIVGAMPITQSTAMSAPFGSVPTINNVQSNVIVKTSLLKNLLELIKRNTHNGFVESPSPDLESFKLLDGNVSVKLIHNLNDFPDNLSEIGLDKISFISFNFIQLLNGIQRLELCPSFHNLFSPNPDVLSEICLIKDFAFWRNNTDSKMFGIDINSKNILSDWNFLFLGEISDNLQIRSQTESLASPTIFNQSLKSLVVSVSLDGDSNPISWIDSKFDKEVGFCAESLAVAGNIELDSQTINFIGFLSPSITNKRADDLNIERGVGFAS